MTTGLLAVIAVAAILTTTLYARPLVAVPGGLLATVAWMVATSEAADQLQTVIAVMALATGIATFTCTLHLGYLVTLRERARLAGDPRDRHAVEIARGAAARERIRAELAERDAGWDHRLDGSRHDLAVDNVRDEIGSAR